ncbi:metabotropic glycine receptor-like [Mytilus edulis]
MNVYCFYHVLYIGVAAMELILCILPRTTQGSMEISQASQMRYYSFQTIKERLNSPSTPRDLTDKHTQTIKDMELESKKSSVALEFMEELKDKSELRRQRCDISKTGVTLKDFKLRFSKSNFQSVFGPSAKKAVSIANTLTSLFFNHKDLDIKHLNATQMPTVFALLKYNVENDYYIAAGGIAFNHGFFPYLAKASNGKTQNLTEIKTNFSEWNFYSVLENRNYSIHWNSNFHNLQTGSNVTQYQSESNGHWTGPYFDCRKLQRWVLTFSVPFFYLRNNKPTFRGVVMIEIDLNKTDINQCAQDDSLFSKSHKCYTETTQCEHIPGGGLRAGSYKCVCRPGYYFPLQNATTKYFSGITMENSFLDDYYNKSSMNSSDFQCLPCLPGCELCDDKTPCMAEYNILLRGIPLGIQSFCITVSLVIGVAVLRLRKTKVMVSGMWVLLEIILIGAVFLYATVIIQYFEPTTTICLVLPWFRELGFAVVYGALILKVYRLLGEFQSRKAHRVHVRDKDLMKYLCCVIIVVLGYMSVWTTVTLDHIREGKTILDTGVTPEDNLKYLVCKSGWWEYVIESAELLFLCFGIYLCYRIRSAPSDYSEGTYISAAICYEAVISTVFYVLRHVYWLNLHPDYLFLMYFVRCQMTVTITLLLVYGPKLLYAHRPPEDHHIRNRAPSEATDNMAPETLKLNVGISSNGDVDVGEISLADMDPEDIRAELKRLYTQLQIYKTRTMRKDNPHISKRRGGRKQTHRRFSLQAFHHKHRHHHSDHDHEHEMSKTPEESTNSAEAVALTFESACANRCDGETHEKETKPREQCTVTFKMGLK